MQLWKINGEFLDGGFLYGDFFMVNKLINMVNTNTDKYGRYSASLAEQVLLEDELMKDMSYDFIWGVLTMDPQVTIASTKHGLVLDDLGSPILGNLYILFPV